MIADQNPALSPEDLRKNFEKLQSDLSIVQSELDQALGVWRSILTAEKQEFRKLLEEREKGWEREETLWQKDREAYEQKILELETFFHKQLDTTEKNAVRALNELDSAWQQERVRWQHILAQQTKESRQHDELQNAALQQLEQRISQVTEENTSLQGVQEEAAVLQAQLAEWQMEKAAWQQSLTERLSELQQHEAAWSADRQEKDALIQTLQQQLVTLESRVRESESTRTSQQQNLDTYVRTLEKQIAGLQDFIQQLVVSSGQPMRRQGDRQKFGPSSSVLWPPPPRVSR